ncbi:tetratricopeptide repeat protein [Paraburkholderia flagellata]|uniref:tetratricopeptide repeat protein n=1 Tax=Paraburkholderia flagellata TaxID=2883241 RepID=UPI001F17F1BE|nr:tetratricopeptide repeat-containing glycosyltransferase family protein [Paraburkholderia flagellata]
MLARHPEHVAAWNNLGLLYKEMNRLPDSEAACRRALALDDSHAEVHNNLGNALWQLGRVEASIEPYQRALALRPDYAAARVNLALPLLRLGAYEAAWPLYEARHEPSMGEGGVARPPVPYPQWHGEPLAGKSILVWSEQGLGDCLQFCRYVPMLKALGAAQVSIACAPSLARLFETLAGADSVIPLNGQGRIERHDLVPDHEPAAALWYHGRVDSGARALSACPRGARRGVAQPAARGRIEGRPRVGRQSGR